MTGPLIQIPYLRPDPLQEVQGGLGGFGQSLQGIGQMLAARQQQQQDQEAKQQQLLMLKGHLALEQEKFDAENQQRNDKKKQLLQLNQSLSQALQTIQSPGGMVPGLGQAATAIGTAGDPTAAAGLLGHIPEAQKQEELTARQRAVGNVLNEFSTGNISDPVRQHAMLLHVAAIDPEAGVRVSESLKNIAGRFVPLTGQDGDIYTLDSQSGNVTKTGYNSGPRNGGLAPQKLMSAASIAAQQLRDIQALLQRDPTADIMPSTAAAIRGAKTGGGVVGALAGLAEPFAQSQLSPGQQQFQRMMDNFIPAYLPILGGGSRGGQYLINLVRNAVAPVAGQNNPTVRADAARIRSNLLQMLQRMAAGRTIDMTGLPGFGAAAQEFSGMTPPSAPQQQPVMPNYQDYLSGSVEP